MFRLGAKDIEDMPVVLQDIGVKEPDAAVTDAHGLGRPKIDIFSMEEVILQFVFADQFRSLVVELPEHADCSDVSFLGSFTFSVELEGLDHFLGPICRHRLSPFGFGP